MLKCTEEGEGGGGDWLKKKKLFVGYFGKMYAMFYPPFFEGNQIRFPKKSDIRDFSSLKIILKHLLWTVSSLSVNLSETLGYQTEHL